MDRKRPPPSITREKTKKKKTFIKNTINYSATKCYITLTFNGATMAAFSEKVPLSFDFTLLEENAELLERH